MPDPTLDAALARGALVVTPNKRLAREIVSRHDRLQAAAGRSTWPAARVLPWAAFVRELVQAAQDGGLPLPPLWLDTLQAAHLWQRVVRAEVADRPLIDADRAARLAAEAWELAHAYGAGGEGWRGFSGSGDVEAFGRWAATYARETARIAAIDAARAADLVAGVAGELPGVRALDVVATGFHDLSPQQQRLLEALAGAGARVVNARARPPRPLVESAARLVACGTSRDELLCALDWARARALRDPQALVAVVVPDLEAQRAAVRTACEDRLCAPLQWPGAHLDARPYDISLGTPLADEPLVASALALITLSQRPLERSQAAALLRSPFLPGKEGEWMRRASLERPWLEEGRREIAWDALVNEVERVDRNLAARWRWASGELARATRLSPRAWVERWRGWLDDVGWCQDRTLSSDAYQAQGAWHELMASFARLAVVAPVLAADEALGTLRRLAGEQIFQPATSGARVRVLGLLEASGLAFDALWVAGMASDAWPRAPEPNPLLPIAWQRERGVPRASAQRELAFAREITAQLAEAAPEVVFSFAASADDHGRTASPLLAGLPCEDPRAPPASTAARMFAARPALAAIADARAPALAAASRLPGGSGALEKQSDCPFRATAAHRLLAQPWPVATLGLTRIERGNLLHATLHAFWSATRTHAALAAMDDETLAHGVRNAFEAAKAALPAARWPLLPPAIVESEAQCVCGIVLEWLGCERERPPFSVAVLEQRAVATAAGHTLNVRIDRVDALATGGIAVIDYKGGRARTPARWFEPRPQGLQAALYARASAQAALPAPARALVYAQLLPGEVKAVGVAADETAWPGLVEPRALKGAALAGWEDATSRLERSIDDLAGAFAAGDAAIAPRDRKVCTLCGLQPLCRIGTPGESVAQAAGADEDD